MHNRARRELLKKALAGGCAVGAAFLSGGLPAAEPEPGVDVIVVGAGMAGLHAAKVLLQKGYRVRILEASHRHGGRIYSQTLGSTRVEMGAEEHYLARNNPIYDAVINAYGSGVYTRAYVGEQLLTIDGNKTCWEDSGDCHLDPDIATFWKYWSRYNNRAMHKDLTLTMADDVAAHYGVDRRHRAYHLYDHSIANSIYGASLDRIGAASVARQDWNWTLSDEIRVVAPGNLGYSDILDQVWWREAIPHIRYARPVTRVDYGGEHVVVTDARGTQHHARQVIVTASIGVLQSETIDFHPELPASTVEAYRGIGMGRGMKVALRFDRQFWESRMSYLVTDGLASSAWAPSHYKTGVDDPILMCYPMGEAAQKLGEMASNSSAQGDSDEIIVGALLDDLDQVFAGQASPAFIDARVQNWSADPFVRGSYSYPKPETFHSVVDNLRRQLGRPVSGRLIFAGEGSNPQNPACVPGALQEGERAAKIVDKSLQGISSPPGV